VLEEMGGLVVDLEWCLVIEGVEIEPRLHNRVVIQTWVAGRGKRPGR
jgi:hypothetical protein